MIVTMGAHPQLWVDQTRSISYVFLVDPKSGGRNKIACRIIKLWNNLINQPAKSTNQVQSIWLVGLWSDRLHVCPREWLFVWPLCVSCSLLSCSKNKHWKQQQQHAQKNCHPWQIQILNFFLQLYILNLLLLFTKIQNVRPVDGLFSTRIQKIAIYFPLLQQQPW